MESYYNYLKALHIIFVVTWFAGLFYVPRLFVYYVESQKKEGLEKNILGKQFVVMTQKLWYIITWPSAILTVLSASSLLYIVPEMLSQQWMIIKLCFVTLLFVYQLKTQQMVTLMKQRKLNYSSFFMRMWNEIPTLILFAVVFLVILKNSLSWIYGVSGIVFLGIILWITIKIYNKFRTS